MPRISHPERILYPESGITRAEVVSYYAEVAPYLLDQARGRLLTIKRWPHGVTGSMFYQKHSAPGVPLVVDGTEELLTWVGRGALEWHAPLGTITDPLVHNWAVLDFDPHPPAGWSEVLTAAQVFKELLDLLEVPFLLKTSGQRGLHFYIFINPLDHRAVTAIVQRWAEMVVQSIPEIATLARLKRDRGPRVYLDYWQNGYARTMVMAYSLRATPSASVSAPITWDEIAHPPEYWTIKTVREHLMHFGNLFSWQGDPVDLLDRAYRHHL